jgi:hypothetical protein
MPFFDKKEDVLDFELTPYGRHLLSKGKLMPKYYAFLDDDVVYDIRHAGGTENNNEIKNRIIDETPSLRPMVTVNSVETQISDSEQIDMGNVNEHGGELSFLLGMKSNPLGQDETSLTNQYVNVYDTFRPTSDTNSKFFQNTIGTSKQGIKEGPRWNLTFIRGDLESTATHITASISSSVDFNDDQTVPTQILNIPQIECDLVYTMEIRNSNDIDQLNADQAVANSSINLQPIEVYDDGTYLKIEEDQVLIDFLEKNGFTHDESYEIEVFRFDETKKDQLHRLKFQKKIKKIVKDILLDLPNDVERPVDENTVEYYFDIRVDEEIAENDICQGIAELKSQGIFVSDYNIKCPDIDALTNPLSILSGGDEPCPDPEDAC